MQLTGVIREINTNKECYCRNKDVVLVHFILHQSGINQITLENSRYLLYSGNDLIAVFCYSSAPRHNFNKDSYLITCQNWTILWQSRCASFLCWWEKMANDTHLVELWSDYSDILECNICNRVIHYVSEKSVYGEPFHSKLIKSCH